MNRKEFNEAMQGEVRVLLQKHERERNAVRDRDQWHGTGSWDKAVVRAAEELDSAIYLFADRIFDLVRGENA